MDSRAFLKSNQGKPLTFSHYDGKAGAHNIHITYMGDSTTSLLFDSSHFDQNKLIINVKLMCVSIEMYPTSNNNNNLALSQHVK